jgi:hypothetical protein
MLAAERSNPTADVPGKATKMPVLCGIEKSVMSSTAKRNEEPRSVPQLEKSDAIKKLDPINA